MDLFYHKQGQGHKKIPGALIVGHRDRFRVRLTSQHYHPRYGTIRGGQVTSPFSTSTFKTSPIVVESRWWVMSRLLCRWFKSPTRRADVTRRLQPISPRSTGEVSRNLQKRSYTSCSTVKITCRAYSKLIPNDTTLIVSRTPFTMEVICHESRCAFILLLMSTAIRNGLTMCH